jgi:hypothetical protein
MLQQVILASVSLDQFDEWLAKASWNMQRDSSPEAISLVGKIELLLAAYDDGLQTEDQTLSSLRALNPASASLHDPNAREFAVISL